jgi:superfamily II DNA/RNA helicase
MMGAGEDNRVTEISMIPSHIAQILHVCATHKKPKKLLGILRKLREAEREGGRTRNQGLLVIFFSKIKTLQFISKLLKKEAVTKITELHGQLKQRERESALNDFKSGKVSVLLSTDVAARGIHVNNIEYIINYDFPTSIEQVSFSWLILFS